MQQVARRLHEVQSGRNPPGLLTMIAGTIGGSPCVSVLKLEREQGLRFRIQRRHGHYVVDLEFLRNLTLTDKTKVFKTSLFGLDDVPNPLTMQGRVSDDQRGQGQARGVADFFLHTFLGCQLRGNAAQDTLSFAQAAQTLLQRVCR